MKAILASFHAEYCQLIASRKKSVELRKNKPKIDVPFKVYMYETKGRMTLKAKAMTPWKNGKTMTDFYICEGRGKVIGEFICDRIDIFEYENGGFLVKGDIATTQDVQAMSCLSDYEFRKYAGEKTVYGWHISDLVIYDKPKELREFYAACKMDCEYCEMWDSVRVNADEFDMDCKSDWFMHKPLTRPPQSWCYVEEVI